MTEPPIPIGNPRLYIIFQIGTTAMRSTQGRYCPTTAISTIEQIVKDQGASKKRQTSI